MSELSNDVVALRTLALSAPGDVLALPCTTLIIKLLSLAIALEAAGFAVAAMLHAGVTIFGVTETVAFRRRSFSQSSARRSERVRTQSSAGDPGRGGRHSSSTSSAFSDLSSGSPSMLRAQAPSSNSVTSTTRCG